METLRERHPVWRQNFLKEHENGAKSKLFKTIQNRVTARKFSDNVASELPRKRRALSDCMSDDLGSARQAGGKRPRVKQEQEVAAINRDI